MPAVCDAPQGLPRPPAASYGKLKCCEAGGKLDTARSPCIIPSCLMPAGDPKLSKICPGRRHSSKRFDSRPTRCFDGAGLKGGMMVAVQVFWLGEHGQKSDNVIDGQPCIEIGIAWDDEAGHAKIPHPRRYEMVVGLIDTGAQAILADDALIARWQMPWTREMNSRSANHNKPTRGHICQLYLPDGPWTTRQEVFSSPLRETGHPYDLLLGRVFLQSFKFTWDRGVICDLCTTVPTASISA